MRRLRLISETLSESATSDISLRLSENSTWSNRPSYTTTWDATTATQAKAKNRVISIESLLFVHEETSGSRSRLPYPIDVTGKSGRHHVGQQLRGQREHFYKSEVSNGTQPDRA